MSAKCKGQNCKHKHAAWGLDKKFASSEETAFPMGLAKMIANCIVMALINLGIKAPEETLHQVKSTSLKSLQQMKAATVRPVEFHLWFQHSRYVSNYKLRASCYLISNSILSKVQTRHRSQCPRMTPCCQRVRNSFQFSLQRH